MKAAFFERPGELKVGEFPDPVRQHGDVLIKVAYAGVNPIDRSVVSGAVPASPMPHVPGAEFVGEVLDPGVSDFKRGDRVVVYNRLFCGLCRQCLRGETQLCEKGGIIGVATNGGWAELAAVPARNLVKTSAPLEQAVGLPVGGLTAYNMLRRAGVSVGDRVAVMGATGNVGIFAVQLAKLMGAYVVAVTRRADRFVTQLKSLGADEVLTPEEVKRAGAFDVVVDPLGAGTWELSFSLLARGGRYVTAGALTGDEVRLSLRRLYGGQYSVIGSTGGRRIDLELLVSLVERGILKAPISQRLSLAEAPQALKALESPERLGKVIIAIG
ncbi:MAG: alcohol dehydrogenase catalytic domain-containing protein [Thermoproteus sp.]